MKVAQIFFPIMQKKTPTDEHASLGVVKLWLKVAVTLTTVKTTNFKIF